MTVRLRSIELSLPDPATAASFFLNIWGLAPAGSDEVRFYLRGSGPFPYLVGMAEGPEAVRSLTFVCGPEELAGIGRRASEAGLTTTPTQSEDPGAGHGIIVELPEGELFRFLTDTTEVEPIAGADLPVKLTHVVLNAIDAETSGLIAEQVLGFKVSDRTAGMVFVRCNDSHHSTAFARAGMSSLNHIAFEMADLDAVMRGIGRLRDHGFPPAWGPGRHGPGSNAFAYYIAPFGAVVEFSTAVDKVPEDYRVGAPDDWKWPPNRIDQWGVSDKDVASLKAAEQRFRFQRG